MGELKVGSLLCLFERLAKGFVLTWCISYVVGYSEADGRCGTGLMVRAGVLRPAL